MKPATRSIDVPRASLAEAVRNLAPLAGRWYVRGPRGGVYEATGRVVRTVSSDGDYFIRNMVRIEDRSEDSRYVRPGTRAYVEALRQFGQLDG